MDNGEGDTRRNRMIKSGNAERCPVVPIPEGGGKYVAWLWELRGFCSENSDPIQPNLLREWSSDMGISLTRAEKGIIYAMDKAFRAQYPKTVAHYSEVKARRDKKGA